MFSFVFAAVLALHLHGASAAPQTFFPNSTSGYPPGPAVTKAPTGTCSTNCTYPRIDMYHVLWVQMYITATYTAETVVLVVNKKNNSTRTTTISNPEIDFAKIATPTNLNSDSTVTASVIDNDGSTRIVAYPTTVYQDYAPSISWTGTLSTTISGIPTCSIALSGAVDVFPSHPLVPEGVQATGVDMIEDPRGWTFTNFGGEACGADCRGTVGVVEGLFPDLGVWNCEPTETAVEAASALETALYLTKTSTSTESDDGPTSTEAPAESTDKKMPAEGGTSNVPPATLPSLAEKTTSAAYIPLHDHILSPWALETAKGLLPVITTSPASAAESIVIKPSPSSAPTGGEPPPTEMNPPEAATTVASPLVTENEDGVVSIMAAHFLSPEAGMAPTTTPAPFEDSTYNAPEVPVSANDLLPADSNPAAPASKSIIITPSPSQAATLPTSPIAVLIPITSTDSKGSISISTSIAVVQPIIISSSNAQGSTVLSTSLSTASISALLPTIITSTNAQGTIFSSSTHLPAIILDITNAADSQILTTSALTLPTVPANTNALVPITINDQTITPNAQSQYIISGSTLTPDSTITLGSGSSTTVLALQTSSGTTALIYGSSTSILSSPPTTALAPAITIGSETITANSKIQYIIGSQTLTPGGVVTVSGTAVSLAAGLSDVVIGSSTETLGPYITAGTTDTTPPAITIGSETIIANSKTQYIIGSQTLTPGRVVTVSGTAVSLAAGMSDVVVGSSTEALGPYITAAFGTGGVNNGTGVQVFATGGVQRRGRGRGRVWIVGVGVGVWMVVGFVGVL